MSQPVGPPGGPEPGRLLAEITRWQRSCEALAASGGEPPTLARLQLHGDLLSLQAQARGVGLLRFERPFSALAQKLDPMRPFAAAVNGGLSALLDEVGRIVQDCVGSASIAPPPVLGAAPQGAANVTPPPLLSRSIIADSSRPQAPGMPPVPGTGSIAPVVLGAPSANANSGPPNPRASANLAVMPMLGLVGFKPDVGRPAGASAALPTAPAQAGPIQAQPQPQAQQQAGSVLGLRTVGAAEGPHAGERGSLLGLRSPASSAPRASDAPPLLSRDLPGFGPLGRTPVGGGRSLPALDSAEIAPRLVSNVHPGEMQEVLDRIRGPQTGTSRARPRSSRVGVRLRERRAEGGIPGWAIVAGALGFAAVVVGVLLIVVRTRRPSSVAAVASATGAPSASAGHVDTPAATMKLNAAPSNPKLVTDEELLERVRGSVHARGGKESPELRAILDEEVAVSSRLLGAGGCQANSAYCKGVHDLPAILSGDAKPFVKRPEGQPNTRWMAGLKTPDLPISDDDRVRRHFEYYSQGRVGRELLQAMIFRCGAYRDLIQSMLIRYEMPVALLALVFLESGCEPTAASPVGAAGLWQFMPETGRAYHLRVTDELDERRNPAKATEAAVHFLADLRQKLGNWEFVMAAYNLGPFGLLARIHKAGDNVTFWDLADNDFLPDETADYVPHIEAIALVLENLQKLKFVAQMRAPENTTDLQVPPGTRLGVIARAAATSIARIKSLNPDILTGQIPAGLRENVAVQVPTDVIWQARDTLQSILSRKDDADLCVPESFDWGKQRFTPEMETDCSKRLASQGRQGGGL